jgi:predicted membrane channel-forming protein YqfA (hemolysin III family)
MTGSPTRHISDIDIERQRDRYISRSLSYLVFLNGAGALIVMAGVAFIPQSTTADLRQLTWAMIVFGAGATAGLLSALLAYINRTLTVEVPYRSNLRSLLRLFAILVAVTGGVAFLTGLNIVGNAAPERSSTHPKSKRQNGAPTPETKAAERLTQRIAIS